VGLQDGWLDDGKPVRRRERAFAPSRQQSRVTTQHRAGSKRCASRLRIVKRRRVRSIAVGRHIRARRRVLRRARRQIHHARAGQNRRTVAARIQRGAGPGFCPGASRRAVIVCGPRVSRMGAQRAARTARAWRAVVVSRRRGGRTGARGAAPARGTSWAVAVRDSRESRPCVHAVAGAGHARVIVAIAMRCAGGLDFYNACSDTPRRICRRQAAAHRAPRTAGARAA